MAILNFQNKQLRVINTNTTTFNNYNIHNNTSQKVDNECFKKKKTPLLIPLRDTDGTIVTVYNCGGTIPNTKEYTGQYLRWLIDENTRNHN